MEKAMKTDLPACPVETTLTLIGDKWKVPPRVEYSLTELCRSLKPTAATSRRDTGITG